MLGADLIVPVTLLYNDAIGVALKLQFYVVYRVIEGAVFTVLLNFHYEASLFILDLSISLNGQYRTHNSGMHVT